LIAYATKRHITVVLVNMPITNQSVDRMPPGSYQTYKLALLKLAVNTGAKAFDFSSIRSTSYFLDDIHLNHAGVELFSSKLGASLKSLVH
jgi:lysophospholipase L1-like esterase